MTGKLTETSIPAKLFGSPDNPVRGVSAVVAIGEATRIGQRLYRLDVENVRSVLSGMDIDDSARAEILSAVNAGKEVVVHAEPINYYGWEGYGYVITDTDTGASAYKISGGANGDESDDDGGGFEWMDLIGFLGDLSDLSGSDLINAIGKILGIISIATQSLSIAQNCPEHAFELSMMYTMGGIAWAAYAAAWITLSIGAVIFFIILGTILLNVMLWFDLQQCKANRGSQ